MGEEAEVFKCISKMLHRFAAVSVLKLVKESFLWRWLLIDYYIGSDTGKGVYLEGEEVVFQGQLWRWLEFVRVGFLLDGEGGGFLSEVGEVAIWFEPSNLQVISREVLLLLLRRRV